MGSGSGSQPLKSPHSSAILCALLSCRACVLITSSPSAPLCGSEWNSKPEPAPALQEPVFGGGLRNLLFCRDGSLFVNGGPAKGRGQALVAMTGFWEPWWWVAVGWDWGTSVRGILLVSLQWLSHYFRVRHFYRQLQIIEMAFRGPPYQPISILTICGDIFPCTVLILIEFSWDTVFSSILT